MPRRRPGTTNANDAAVRASQGLKGKSERQENEQDVDSDRLVENGLHDGCRRRAGGPEVECRISKDEKLCVVKIDLRSCIAERRQKEVNYG